LRWVQSLRALDTIILMGKNTMMKRCLKVYIERTGNDKWQCLYDQLLGNVGLVFTAVRPPPPLCSSCIDPGHGAGGRQWCERTRPDNPAPCRPHRTTWWRCARRSTSSRWAPPLARV
jgi:hypothetical protein